MIGLSGREVVRWIGVKRRRLRACWGEKDHHLKARGQDQRLKGSKAISDPKWLCDENGRNPRTDVCLALMSDSLR